MSIIITGIVIFITIFLSLFTITPIMIIFAFGIPYTLYLNKVGALKTYAPIKREVVSALLLGAVFLLYGWAVLVFTGQLSALVIGVVIPVILSFGKIGKNASNISDYVSSNARYINKEVYEKLDEGL